MYRAPNNGELAISIAVFMDDITEGGDVACSAGRQEERLCPQAQQAVD